MTGGISSSADTKSNSQFLIGEAPTSSSSNTIYLKTYLDCSDYINKEDFKDKKTLKQKVKDCITLKYKTNVQWKLITFQKDQTEDKIYYTYNGDLGDKYQSFNKIRQIDENTLTNYDNTCSQTTTSQSQESQNYCKKHEDEIKKELEEKGKQVVGVFDTLDEALKVCNKDKIQPLNIADAKVTCQICIK